MRLRTSTMATTEYWELAKLTSTGKLEHAMRWGCGFKLSRADEYTRWMRLQQMLDDLDGCDWLWHTGADVLVTNHTIDPHGYCGTNNVSICEDPNGINNDSIFLRNCGPVRELLQWSAKLVQDGKFSDDQDVLAHLFGDADKWRVTRFDPKVEGLVVRVYPQRAFNSFPDMAYYGLPGDEGTWYPEDFVAHFPGMPVERRISRVMETLEMVVR